MIVYFMGTQWRPLGGGTAVVIALVALAGCLTTPATDPTETESPERGATETTSEVPAALDSQLAGLVTADNRSAYAAATGLEYERETGSAGTAATDSADGRVRVVLVLAANATVPEGDNLTVVASANGLVEATVHVGDLYSLARAGGIRVVRPPRTPAADGIGGTGAP
jgi:hypothetical protein